MIPEESLQQATEIAGLALGPAGVDAKAGDTAVLCGERNDTFASVLEGEAAVRGINLHAPGMGPYAGAEAAVIGFNSPAVAKMDFEGGPDCTEFRDGWPMVQTIIPVPTTEWVDTRFGGDAARLWAAIHRAMRLDQPDPDEAWRERHDFLQGVMEKVEGLNIHALRFEGAGGATDLLVPIAESSVWNCGRVVSEDGIQFSPNLPCEEIFATPDWRGVKGTAVISRPFDWISDSAEADELTVHFKGTEGVEIPDAPASLREALGGDPSEVRIGEIALVDGDSAVAAAGVDAFWETILDENAACHLAFGSALPMGYTDPDDPGVNRQGRHFDVVIGTDDMRVTAQTENGELLLLDRGKWADEVLPDQPRRRSADRRLSVDTDDPTASPHPIPTRL